MLVRKNCAVLLVGAALISMPAFSQEAPGRNEASVQAFGAFVKSTTDNGVQQGATNSGGVLASYRFLLNDRNGIELNYGYALNTQTYGFVNGTTGLNARSHEATAAYVLRFPMRRLTPFVLAGGGALVFDPNNAFAGNAQARPAFLYGGGADFHVTSRVFVRAGYRGLVYNSPTLGASTVAAELLTHRAEPSAGFGFRF